MLIYACGKLLLACVLFLAVLQSAESVGVFIEEPSPVVVAENDTAVFYCRVSSNGQGWTVNGHFVDSQNSADFFTRSASSIDGGPYIVHQLSIIAHSIHNNSKVLCSVFGINGTHNSSIATLLIQGTLAAVPTLVATPLAGSILFNWAAPFSLNLTNTEPDITYCVDVYNSTGERTELVAGGCALTETQYSFTADVTSPCDTFTAVVTPVNRAGNGTASQPVTGTFFAEFDVNGSICAKFSMIHELYVVLTIQMLSDVCLLRTLTAFIMSNDAGNPIEISLPLNGLLSSIQASNNATHSVILQEGDGNLKICRKYNAVIESSSTSIPKNSTKLITFSTHSTQDVLISNSSFHGGMVIEVTLASDSTAIGFLAIILGSDGSCIYMVSYTPDTVIAVSGLSTSYYRIGFFDIDMATGLPKTLAAVETAVSLLSNDGTSRQKLVDPNFFVEEIPSGIVCITCSFPTTFVDKGCIILVYSFQQVLGVYNITTPPGVRDATTQGTMCFDDLAIDGGFLSIAVFVWRSNGVIAQTPSTVHIFDSEQTSTKKEEGFCSGECLIISVSASVGVFGAVVSTLLVIYVIWLCNKRNPGSTNAKIQMKENLAYEAPAHLAGRVRVSSSQVNQPSVSEPLYETVC